ncbi:hypothetical protein PVL30_005167 [Lodderomyces elongisporus]|uniref:uncharacterized protein n=1 Tax=Lodderomyces elongisporus TaxID=36914 RepID=UPI00291F14EE|nr:uncharacterized protein PVL30_005167 [Lodderomyces elongisporus]WLF81370.1 hypothetical protein PVL30_005167 [Lodderomyces elongisporus]
MSKYSNLNLNSAELDGLYVMIEGKLHPRSDLHLREGVENQDIIISHLTVSRVSIHSCKAQSCRITELMTYYPT